MANAANKSKIIARLVQVGTDWQGSITLLFN